MSAPRAYTPIEIPAAYEVTCPYCTKPLDGAALMVRVLMNLTPTKTTLATITDQDGVQEEFDAPQVWAVCAHAVCAIQREELVTHDAEEPDSPPLV